MVYSLHMQHNNQNEPCYHNDQEPLKHTDVKVVDLSLTVNQLCTADPELIATLASIGFVEIVKPMMLATVGRVMTIPKGSAMRKLDLEVVKEQLRQHGYTVIDQQKETSQ